MVLPNSGPPAKRYARQTSVKVPKDVDDSMKRSAAEKTDDYMELQSEALKRKDYLREKAKTVSLPTADDAALEPKYMFNEQMFIAYMCYDCCRQSRNEKTIPVEGDDEREKLVLNLCRICRDNLNAHRRTQFFHHVLPHIKEKHDAEE
ncbi:hypothetical protein GCK72_002925 [Caenorhabditis remanei]|nr:hypothetical protein GCK72_015241 [Caenorhabditis remanei]XP_053592341.1 hypothetical protein GCK72_002925 [Caenorhabditis remanei]KAF1758781.1 hypothetical protein GCK72_015241 [Caenorhabditis remanei]KAF1771100.1 hypothetical protein GCK72_002925 [Caenorhabditis remanei]